MTDEVKKLYTALLSKGYSTADLGDESTFRSKMSDKSNRRDLYDWVSSKGNFRLGDYDTYESRLTSTPTNTPSTQLSTQQVDIIRRTADALDKGNAPVFTEQQLNEGLTPNAPLTGFWEGAAQGGESLVQGGKYYIGDTGNMITANAQNYKDALDYLNAKGDNWDASNFDADAEVEENQKKRFNERVAQYRETMKQRKKERENMGFWDKLGHIMDDPDAPDMHDTNMGEAMVDRVKADKPVYLLKEALEESGGDVKKARAILEEKSKMGDTWAQRWMREASDKFAQMRPVEGAAWWGQMLPQMTGQATALGLSAIPATRGLGAFLGAASTTGLMMSSAGASMNEARAAGATDAEVRDVGMLAMAIEGGSEALPFGRLMNRVGKTAIREGFQKAASEASEAELNKLLKEAKAKIGGKFLSYNTGKELFKDVVAEGASEVAAGMGEQLLPLVYGGEMPTLQEYFENAFEQGAAGLVMGGFLGGGSHLITHYGHQKRREAQGGVAIGEYTNDNGGKEWVEVTYSKGGKSTIMHQDGTTEEVSTDKLDKGHFFTMDEWNKGIVDANRVRLESAYASGKSATDPAELQSIGDTYSGEYNYFVHKYGKSKTDEVINNAFGAISTLEGNEKEDAMRLAEAYNSYRGVSERFRADMQQAKAEAEATIDSHISQEDGMIHKATLKDGRDVYIVGGNVVQSEDGSVDLTASTGSVAVTDAKTGDIDMISPDDFVSLEQAIDPKEERERVLQESIAMHQGLMHDALFGGVAVGETHTVLDTEGNPIQVQVVADNGDGTVNVTTDGQMVIPMSKDDVLLHERNTRMADYQMQRGLDMTGQSADPVFHLGDGITFTDADGNTISGTVASSSDDGVQIQTPSGVLQRTREMLNDAITNVTDEDGNVRWDRANPVGATSENEGSNDVASNGTEGGNTTPQAELSEVKKRMPKNDKGELLYEQAEADDAWDAILEDTDNDVEMAQRVANEMVAQKEAELKAIEKKKTKSAIKPQEKIAIEKARKEEITKAKQDLEAWKNIAGTTKRREDAAKAEERRRAEEAAAQRKAEEERLKAEREEAARQEREALNGVPDMADDTPQDARARGYRRVGGHKVERQSPVRGVAGKDVQVKFSNKAMPQGRVMVIDANELQPSHTQGQRNAQHFLDEAQPKERKDSASMLAAQKIAENIRPEEITSSVTSYTGAPTTNSRGEVIQGNSRSDALKQMWDSYPEQSAKYKQYLIDHAEELGLDAEAVAQMERPVLVNMLEVADEDAITLGQFVAQDTESGGVERIKAKNVLQKMGSDVRNFANRLLQSADEDTSFAGLIDANGATVIQWMAQKGYITPTQQQSAYDGKGNLTAEAKNDLRSIMYQSIFKGGNTQLEEMFNALPVKAQKAILATAYRDFDSPVAERMIEEIQSSISAFYVLSQDSAFASARNITEARAAIEAWKNQYQMDDVTGESYLPSDKFSNFALHLATMYKGENQSVIQGTFNKMFDLIQGIQEADLFNENPDTTPRTLVEAIKEVLNIDYNGQLRSNVLGDNHPASQRGQQGSTGNVASGKQNQNGQRTDDGGRRTEGDGGRSRSEAEDRTSQSEEDATEIKSSSMSADEAIDFVADMELSADIAPEIDLTIENWDALFGENGTINTPIGEVKMGENQFAKLMRQGRDGKLGMIKPTLEKPHAIVEEASEAKDGDTTERASSYIFIRSFKKEDGSRYYYFTSITVSKDGREVVVSSQEKSRNKILRLLQEGSVIWRTPKDATTSSAERQGLDYEQPIETETATKGSGITPQSTSSDSKVTDNSSAGQKNAEENVSGGVNELIAQAESETDVTPTEGQKKAGNYKKGKVKVAGYEISIEQPKGSVRRGVDANGKAWEQTMHNTYGYFLGTEGVDGDHIDVFLANDMDAWNGEQVFVVDQYNEDGSFDEHKVMLGFNSIEEAQSAYLSNYEDGWADKHNIVVTGTSASDFKKWVDSSHRKTKAFADYKTVKTTDAQSMGDKLSPIEGYTYDEVIESVTNDIQNALSDADFDIEIAEVWAHGSRMRGDAKEDSDLDVVLFYKGDSKEDALFNAINEAGISINGINVDVNPIQVRTQKDIDRYKQKSAQYDAGVRGKRSDSVATEGAKVKKVANEEAKIEDVGEVLAGARKDALKVIASAFENATVQSLIELPFAKAFKKPDLKKAVESGALREEDAAFYEAWFSTMINTAKPKLSRRVRESHVRSWAEDVYKSLQVLKEFVEADVATRDRVVAEMMANKFPTEAEELAKIEQRKEWNKGSNTTWGDKTTPNRLWVAHEVLKRLGYKVGDKLDIPFGILHANATGTGYDFYNSKGQRLVMNAVATVEEGIERIVYLTKLKRGDADVKHPVSSFTFVPTKTDYAESGKYRVIYGSIYNPSTKEFDSLPEAEAFAKKRKDSFVSPIKKVGRQYAYKVTFVHPLTGDKMVADEKEFDTRSEAEQYLQDNYDAVNEHVNDELAKERGEKRALSADDVVEVVAAYRGGKVEYVVNVSRNYANNMGMPLPLRSFATRAEAVKYASEIKDDVFKAVQQSIEDRKSFTFFATGEDTRIGEDYRQGKDVTADEFMEAFGFRGVQFGNWTNQRDRQMAVNQAYDALHDLAKLLGVSPKALSLNGELGIAFGSRGSGNANAHYELDEVVINLTKTRGAGSLAHEWWHALDNYFARMAEVPRGMVTDSRNLPMREALREAFNALLSQVDKSKYLQRSKSRGDYWGRMHEVTARLLAEWVDQSLKAKGEVNTFLSRGADVEKYKQMNYKLYKRATEVAGETPMPYEEFAELDAALDGIPYPTAEEVSEFGAALRRIFDVMQERETDDGKVALFNIADESLTAERGSEAFERATERTIDALKAAGVEVLEATDEMVEGVLELADVEFLRTADGVVYGWAVDGKIYLTKEGMNPNTPAHEYTHLWAHMIEKTDPTLWNRIVHSLKGCATWNEVLNNKAYESIWNDDNRMASEVLSRLTGSENYRREMARAQQEIADAKGALEKAEKISAWENVKQALKAFLDKVRKLLNINGKTAKVETNATEVGTTDIPSWMEFVNWALEDLYGGVNPVEVVNRRGRDAQSVETIIKDFNLHPSAFAEFINTREDFEKYKSILDEKIYKAAVEEYEKGAGGVSFSDSGLVFVFKENCIDEHEEQIVWWHEQSHVASHNLPISDEYKDELAKKALKWLEKNAPKVHERILTRYKKDAWNEEGIAMFMGELVSRYGTSKFLKADFADLGELSTLADIIRNSIKYGTEDTKKKFDGGYGFGQSSSKSVPEFDLAHSRKNETLQERRLLGEGSEESGSVRGDATQGDEHRRNHRASTQGDREVSQGDVVTREGEGSFSDDALSGMSDPMAKMLGASTYSARQRREFAERARKRMVRRAESIAKELHLDNVEVVTDVSVLPEGKKRGAKGFYSKSTGKITIVVPNHAGTYDIQQTVLHEAVAHYGLRQLFGTHFDTFLDNVFENVSSEIRNRIIGLARQNGWDFRTATEEYLAMLAEDVEFSTAQKSSWWSKIKGFFLKMLADAGVKLDFTLSDNELRYILWRSYQNLANPGKYASIVEQAADIAKQYDLKVGNYRDSATDLDAVAEQVREREDVLFREDTPRERAIIRDRYERRVKTGWYQTQEALQDSMLGLKEAMEAIVGDKTYIEDIEGFENAYLGENRLSSVNKAEIDWFVNNHFKPLYEIVKSFASTEEEQEVLEDYMFAKHGLERNRVMAEREAQKAYDAYKAEHPRGSKTLSEFVDEYRKQDYAGLTALTGKENVAEAEAEAQRMVAIYETEHSNTDLLWLKWNQVTKAILEKTYKSGIISKQTFDKISGMYEYYVPLRGFDETTSMDEYAYLGKKDNGFNPPVKVAGGRRSKADNPFAYLESMAESAIMQGNRNELVKQKMLNFVLNHPSDLFSVSELWLEHDDVTDEWKPVFPTTLSEHDSPEEIQQKMDNFEARMEALAKATPDKYKRGRDAKDIPYRVVDKATLSEHQVIVKRNGRSVIITVNGNPRAAQALNGMTNPDNHAYDAIGRILRAGESINRKLSTVYTTRNPDFVASNFLRDALYTNTMVWVKESPNYALKFHKNWALCNPIKMGELYKKYQAGTLDMSDELEAIFKQFMLNGGETGYMNMSDVEAHKKEIAKKLRGNKYRKAWDYLNDKLDYLNRTVENTSRFAAFVTSRQMGRSIDRSIYDAKEISVNFNKKGSGGKILGATGQTGYGNAASIVSALGRSGFVFWNAGIQGSTNFGRQVKRHPVKALTAAASMFMLGALMAYFGLDDDDEDYYNVPDYIRRSNIMIPTGGDHFISLPLPIEFRAMYGMGELMMSVMSGKERKSGWELGLEIASQASQVFPIDVLEGGGGWAAFVPSSVKPIVEVYRNVGWSGLPIYKDNPFNKLNPEYTEVYSNTHKWSVAVAEWLNNNTGGDAHTKGAININPAAVEYLLSSYLGGYSSTVGKLIKMGETIAGEREYDPRSFLLWNRLVKSGDERTEERAITNEYFKLKDEAEVVAHRLRGYNKDTKLGIFDYSEKIDFLEQSPEYGRYTIFEPKQKRIDRIERKLKKAQDRGNDDAVSRYKELITDIQRDIVEECREYDRLREESGK